MTTLSPAGAFAGEANADCLGCHGEKGLGPSHLARQDARPVREARRAEGLGPRRLLVHRLPRRGKGLRERAAQRRGGRGPRRKAAGAHLLELPREDGQEYGESIHGQTYARGDRAAATCGNCHGSHDILKAANRQSHTNKFNLPKDLRRLPPEQGGPEEPQYIGQKEAVPHFIDSIHGAPCSATASWSPRTATTATASTTSRRPPTRSRTSTRTTCRRPAASAMSSSEDLQQEHPRPAAREVRQARPDLQHLPQSHEIDKPSSPEFRIKSDQKCGGATKPARALPRDVPRQGDALRRRASRPATTATATTTSCRRPVPSLTSATRTGSPPAYSATPRRIRTLRGTSSMPTTPTRRVTRTSTTSSCS